MSDLQVEVMVLGSGPGGYSAAFRAADLGKRVALVERYPTLGGVCLNVGCIPSKALLHLAKVIDETRHFSEHGVDFGAPRLDLDKIRAWKDAVVSRLVGGVGTMARQRKVEVVEGTGAFTSPHTLLVETADGPTTIGFEHAIIAAGSRVAQIPGFPYDDPRLMDSTGALELAEVPERLLVIGGGIIGLEMATVYHALGSRITVVELLDGLIPGCDRDLVRPLHKRLEQRYENIFLKTMVQSVEATGDGLEVRFEGANAPEIDVFDRILLAVGRRPNGHEVGAEAAGVAVDERGFISVDNQLRTNVPHIFAIGDVAGEPMLAHKATHEAHVAAEVIAGEKSAFDARVIPSVAYTDPEVAWVGVTETEAKARGVKLGKGNFPWAANGRSLAIGRDEGKTKLLFEADTDRVVGAGIVGPGAGDLIAELALAIEMGADAQDVALTIHPHPTTSETVGMAAEAFEGTLTDLYLPRRKKR
ncbi:MAG: dihydrolipoyl dehydrogenase [bacterium]|nr:dihydrolipoyl dehydrogenase [bacterium]